MFVPPPLLTRVEAQLSQWQPIDRLWIAYSGGVDSTALLLIGQQLQQAGCKVSAIHINHQLHSDAANWQRHCQHVAAQLDIQLLCRTVKINSADGLSPEQGARNARYAVFTDLLTDNDLLLTAHHADDQAETVLLNLLRGSGPRGLAGIPAVRPLGRGRVGRPLLGIKRAQLQAIVTASALPTVEDGSNMDPGIPRNYLRHQILPALAKHWPGANQAIGRAAQLSRQSDDLLSQVAHDHCAKLVGTPDRSLDLGLLQRHPEAMQAAIVRNWLQQHSLPTPQQRQLSNLLAQLSARQDAQVLVSWPGCEVRRYRDRLFASSPLTLPSPDWEQTWHGPSLTLPAAAGQLSWQVQPDDHRSVQWPALQVRFRRGGERIRPAGQAQSRPLKLLFQEHAIAPWLRAQTPLLFDQRELVAVGDYWQTEGFENLLLDNQLQLIWQRG